MSALYILWCALLWRIRGGAWETLLGLPPGTTRARIATSLLMALPLAVETPFAVALAPALWGGMAMAGWGHAMDIGRTGGSRWGDAALMSCWGIVTVLPTAAVMVFLGGLATPLVFAGLLFGPLYALAWHLQPHLPQVPRVAREPTEWAELACGAAIGAALWRACP